MCGKSLQEKAFISSSFGERNGRFQMRMVYSILFSYVRNGVIVITVEVNEIFLAQTSSYLTSRPLCALQFFPFTVLYRIFHSSKILPSRENIKLSLYLKFLIYFQQITLQRNYELVSNAFSFTCDRNLNSTGISPKHGLPSLSKCRIQDNNESFVDVPVAHIAYIVPSRCT